MLGKLICWILNIHKVPEGATRYTQCTSCGRKLKKDRHGIWRRFVPPGINCDL